jgi:hypothetical protein
VSDNGGVTYSLMPMELLSDEFRWAERDVLLLGGRALGDGKLSMISSPAKDSPAILGDYPGTWVVLNCRACSRDFRYLKTTLVRFYGPELTLEQLREKFRTDCPRKSAGGELCDMHYPELSGPCPGKAEPSRRPQKKRQAPPQLSRRAV